MVCASGVVILWRESVDPRSMSCLKEGARHDGTQFDLRRTRSAPSALSSLAMAHHTVANNFSNTTGAPILVNSQLVQERDNRWLDGGNVRRSRNKSSF